MIENLIGVVRNPIGTMGVSLFNFDFKHPQPLLRFYIVPYGTLTP